MQLSLALDDDPVLPRLRARLLALYGPQRDALRQDPTSQFVQVMLSPRTLDTVSGAAFLRLRAHFRSWEALPDADPQVVLAIIHDVTYAPDKACYLIAAASIIRERCSRLDLSFLDDWAVDPALAWLLSLPGVGLRAAATILNFSSLRKRVFAIDTHVLRLSQRLGLVEKADLRACFHRLMALFPEEWDADALYELHWLMKMHGQKICQYYWTACNDCPLKQLCDYHIAGSRGAEHRLRSPSPGLRLKPLTAPSSGPHPHHGGGHRSSTIHARPRKPGTSWSM